MENKKYYIYSMNIVAMNVLGISFGLLLFIPLLTNRDYFMYFINQRVLICQWLIPWFVFHEIIHGLSYRLSKGVTWNDITFGAELEKGVLYCLCKKLISKKDIYRSILAPFMMIGVVTLILGLVFDNKLLVILSCMNIMGAIMDLLMACFFTRLPKDIEYTEIDNGTKFVIASKQDISNIKFVGLQLEKVEEDFEKIRAKDFQKIKISKFSAIFAIIYLILIAITILI